MNARFVIKSIVNNNYWYGFYIDKIWCDDIKEAKEFGTKEEATDYLNFNRQDILLCNNVVTILEIYL